MKTLKTYINESYETYRLNNVKVTYDCKPDEFIVEAPETYQESDIQQYLDDKLLINLPSGIDYSEKFFGKNHDSISDIYFEYDTFEHMKDENKPSKISLKWDPRYNNNNKDVTLNYFKITNLKYIIIFDRFDILNGNDDNVQRVLEEVFMATVSNNENEYPIEISLDTKNIEYSK
jgi:hypothetical protein